MKDFKKSKVVLRDKKVQYLTDSHLRVGFLFGFVFFIFHVTLDHVNTLIPLV